MSKYIAPTVSPNSDIKLSEVDVSMSAVSSCLQSVRNTCSADSIPAFAYYSCTSLLPLFLVSYFYYYQPLRLPAAWK